jgi:hypothetical protein
MPGFTAAVPIPALSCRNRRSSGRRRRNEKWILFRPYLDARRGEGPGRRRDFPEGRRAAWGDPYFWSIGSYTSGNGTWKGDLLTNQHTPSRDCLVSPLFRGREVASGFSGTYQGDDSEVFGTTLVGSRSLSFRATLRWLADN